MSTECQWGKRNENLKVLINTTEMGKFHSILRLALMERQHSNIGDLYISSGNIPFTTIILQRLAKANSQICLEIPYIS